MGDWNIRKQLPIASAVGGVALLIIVLLYVFVFHQAPDSVSSEKVETNSTENPATAIKPELGLAEHEDVYTPAPGPPSEKTAPMSEKHVRTEISPGTPEEFIARADRLELIWPTKGKVLEGFSEITKGLDIGGEPGQAVIASAAGKVVYSGAGLRGYGKLIIIKHNNTYLSAYAHNDKLLVEEGQTVTKGQKIAEMGSTGTTAVKLHFEVRKNGKIENPLKYLPRLSE